MKENQILIYDTTLRDGSQAEGVSFTVAAKLRVAEKLDQFGIDYIEEVGQEQSQRHGRFRTGSKPGKNILKSLPLVLLAGRRYRGKDAQVKLLLEANTPDCHNFRQKLVTPCHGCFTNHSGREFEDDRRYGSILKRTVARSSL